MHVFIFVSKLSTIIESSSKDNKGVNVVKFKDADEYNEDDEGDG